MVALGIIALFLLGSAQLSVQQDVDSLIDQVFYPSTNSPDSEPSNRETATESTGDDYDDCKCVPFFQCSSNNTIITDGANILDIRSSLLILRKDNKRYRCSLSDRIKDPGCEDPMQICCKVPIPKEKVVTPKPFGRLGCGQRHIDGVGFRIVGNIDNEAQFGEFPWMVAISVEEKIDGTPLNVYQCGGALIHENVIVTAAHCVVGKDASILKVRAGEWDTQSIHEIYPHQDRDVKQIIIHDKYYSGGLHNDIALVITTEPFKFEENVDIICLPKANEEILNNECYASGWGKDKFGKGTVRDDGPSELFPGLLARQGVLDENGSRRKRSQPDNVFFMMHREKQKNKPLANRDPISNPSSPSIPSSSANKETYDFPGNNVYFKMFLEKKTNNKAINKDFSYPGKEGNYHVILKRVELPMVPRRDCEKQLKKTRLGEHFVLHESFVCAGGVEGKDTCKGDGGSPLVCPIPGRKFQYQHVGIVAWGIGCGDKTPGVYVNVAKFRDWIDKNMKRLNYKTEYTY